MLYQLKSSYGKSMNIPAPIPAPPGNAVAPDTPTPPSAATLRKWRQLDHTTTAQSERQIDSARISFLLQLSLLRTDPAVRLTQHFQCFSRVRLKSGCFPPIDKHPFLSLLNQNVDDRISPANSLQFNPRDAFRQYWLQRQTLRSNPQPEEHLQDHLKISGGSPGLTRTGLSLTNPVLHPILLHSPVRHPGFRVVYFMKHIIF